MAPAAAAAPAAPAAAGDAPARSPPPKKKPVTRSPAAPAATSAGTSVSMRKQGENADGAGAGAAGAADGNGGDLFARHLSLMAVAHVARGAGFDALSRAAADALVDVMAKYIQRIGEAAKDNAELAGRTLPRATDVTQALQDLVPAPVAVTDLVRALETAKRPFPRDVPAFPVRKRDLAGNAIEQTAIGRRENLPPHVPSFLPPLPNRHSYSNDRPAVVERDHDTKRVRLGLLDQKARVQQSLHGLQSVAAKKAVPVVHQPSWSAFQGSTGDNATENPFVQAPIVAGDSAGGDDTMSVFERPARAFAPSSSSTKAQKKSNSIEATAVKLSNSQELGKEEKILMGTFHDGDSE